MIVRYSESSSNRGATAVSICTPSATMSVLDDAWDFGTILRDTNSIRATGREIAESVSDSTEPAGLLPIRKDHFAIVCYVMRSDVGKHMHVVGMAGQVPPTEELHHVTDTRHPEFSSDHVAIHVFSQTRPTMSEQTQHDWQRDADSCWVVDSANKNNVRSKQPDLASPQEFAEKVSEFFAELAQKQEPLGADFEAAYFR